MNKKNIAIMLEIIPILSAVISFMLLIIPNGSNTTSRIMPIVTLIAFLGFVFYFIGKKLYKDNKLAKILRILDLISTAYVIILYILAIFSFGL